MPRLSNCLCCSCDCDRDYDYAYVYGHDDDDDNDDHYYFYRTDFSKHCILCYVLQLLVADVRRLGQEALARFDCL